MNDIKHGSFQGTSWSKEGTGSPVILVHGLGMNRQMWQWQMDSLTPHFSVICFDLLGHGESVNPEIPCQLSQFSGQLLALMDGLNLESCALVGFSLGGLIVQDFALNHPEKVNALVMLNTAHGRTKSERKAVLARVQQAGEHGPASTVEAHWNAGLVLIFQQKILKFWKKYVAGSWQMTKRFIRKSIVF